MAKTPITLARLALTAKRAASAQRRADEAREARDRMIVELSANGVPHRVIGEAAVLSHQAVGKITRAGGILHWTRSSNPSPRRREVA